jgi:hypothetical protein
VQAPWATLWALEVRRLRSCFLADRSAYFDE